MLWGREVNVGLKGNHPPFLQEQFGYYGVDNVA